MCLIVLIRIAGEAWMQLDSISTELTICMLGQGRIQDFWKGGSYVNV